MSDADVAFCLTHDMFHAIELRDIDCDFEDWLWETNRDRRQLTRVSGEYLPGSIGPFALNTVVQGDSHALIQQLPDESIDVVVTSPPYWGQRMSAGSGVEEDPRDYVRNLVAMFDCLLPKMKRTGIMWLNVGDAYNTPVNWSVEDMSYSTLGPGGTGLEATNSAYTKPRHKRRAFIEKQTPWLTYGNLLGLPYRLVLGMSDGGWLFRGEVIWRKKNPMPEGKARRPHRQHEPIYLMARDEKHQFRTSPPVGSVWEFGTDRLPGLKHFSRFPLELLSLIHI